LRSTGKEKQNQNHFVERIFFMRNLDPGLEAAFAAGVLYPAFFAMLTFRSATEYVWTGPGPIVAEDAHTYSGIGSLAGIGGVTEGLEVQASGTSLTLSGIDPALLAESLADIKSGAPAKVWIGALTPSGVLIARYLWFSGVIDKPEVSEDDKTISITLALESRLLDFGRATQRRYTSADQRLVHPTDMAMDWVEIQNDIAINWGG
jgi:hypothetical protein